MVLEVLLRFARSWFACPAVARLEFPIGLVGLGGHTASCRLDETGLFEHRIMTNYPKRLRAMIEE